MTSGTTLPSTCTVGQQFFKTNATAGSNLYACTSTNTWTLQAGGSGSTCSSTTSVLKGNGSGGCVAATAGTDFSKPDTSETTSGNRTITGALTALGATSTAPMKGGTSLPATCTIGELYFKTDATAGQNIYECAATNTWTQQLNSGGGANNQYCTVTYGASLTIDLSATSGGNTCSIFAVTLTGNVTSVTLSNPSTARSHFEIWWIQDGTGGRTVSGLPGTAIGFCTPQTVASKMTIQPANYDGTNYQAEACSDVNGTGTVAAISAIQSGSYLYCLSATGNATATCSLTPALTAYTAGQCLVFKNNFTNTTTYTVNVNSLGAKSILDPYGAALAAGAITTGVPTIICYDGTQFIQQSKPSSGGGGAITSPRWLPWGSIQAAAGVTTVALGAANRVNYYVLQVNTSTTITSINADPNSSAPGHVAWAIYDSSCNLVAQTNTVNTSSDTPTQYTFSSPPTVSPGYIYVAFTSDVSTVQWYGPADGYFPTLGNVGLGSSTYNYFSGANASTGTTTLTFPSACGTRTALTGSTSVPAIFIQ